ncbi:MAG TPA: MFS transporter [Pilimelia sp.]|nr:MFS transporter [Pilimelia sp.]
MRERTATGKAVGALLALSISAFAYVTTEILPIGLLSLIADDLRSSPSAVGLLVTGYGLVVVLASVPLTRLTRRLSRRSLLTVLLGIFVVATCVSAVAPTYWLLLVARMLTALSQALFWSVIAPAAAGLFSPAVRGRAIAVLFAGSSLAGVLGVPAGTWLGQQAGWRAAFLGLAGLGLVCLVAIAALLPTVAPGHSHADRGSTPDAGRYWSLVVMTALAVTGAFTAFTYVTPFLTDISGFPPSALGPLLLLRGLTGVLGVVAAGILMDRWPWPTMVGLVAVQVLALGGQFVFGASRVPAAATVAVAGLTLSALATALGARVLQVAPGSSDMAAAGTSTAFNVGITAGALIGSLLLPSAGVRSTALVGALLTVAALVVVLLEPTFTSARRRRPPAAERVAEPAGGVGAGAPRRAAR